MIATSLKTTQLAVGFGSPEIRGRIRLWKQELAKQYRVIDRICHDRKFDMQMRHEVDDFVRKEGRVGRNRAFQKIARRLGPGVRLEGVRLGGPEPLAVFSILKPRQPVAIDAAPETGRAQNCIAVDYVLVGALPEHSCFWTGLWCLEVPDHALGRAMQRSSMPPAAIIREAFLNVTRIPAHQLELIVHSQTFIAAGNGGFVCDFICGPDASSRDALVANMRARTWLSDDMTPGPAIVIPDYGDPAEDTLGDSLFAPQPLRCIEAEGSGEGVWIHAYALGKGMPPPPVTTRSLTKGAHQ